MTNTHNPMSDHKPPILPLGNLGFMFLIYCCLCVGGVGRGWQHFQGTPKRKFWLTVNCIILVQSLNNGKVHGLSHFLARVVRVDGSSQVATSNLFWAVSVRLDHQVQPSKNCFEWCLWDWIISTGYLEIVLISL